MKKLILIFSVGLFAVWLISAMADDGENYGGEAIGI